MQYSLNSQNINKTLVANIERNNQWYGFSNYMDKYYFNESQPAIVISTTSPSSDGGGGGY
jgi:hypothetical protein